MFAFFTKVQDILGKVVPTVFVLAGVAAVVVLFLAIFGVVPFYALFITVCMSISVLVGFVIIFLMSDEVLTSIESK